MAKINCLDSPALLSGHLKKEESSLRRGEDGKIPQGARRKTGPASEAEAEEGQARSGDPLLEGCRW